MTKSKLINAECIIFQLLLANEFMDGHHPHVSGIRVNSRRNDCSLLEAAVSDFHFVNDGDDHANNWGESKALLELFP